MVVIVVTGETKDASDSVNCLQPCSSVEGEGSRSLESSDRGDNDSRSRETNCGDEGSRLGNDGLELSGSVCGVFASRAMADAAISCSLRVSERRRR